MRLNTLLTTSLLSSLTLTACTGDDVTADTDGVGSSTGDVMTTAMTTAMTTMSMTTDSADSSGTTAGVDTTAGDASTTAMVSDSSSTGMNDTSGTTDAATGTTEAATGTTDGATGSTGSTGLMTGTTDPMTSTSTTGGGSSTGGTTGGGMSDVYCSSPAAAIGPAAGTVTIDTIDVPALAGFVGDVNVSLLGTHSFVADLDIAITHVPTGATTALMEDQCVGGDDFDVTFDQQGNPLVCSGAVPAIAGDVLPLGNLGAFVGIADGSGQWQLTITDDAAGDGGVLTTWCVELIASVDDPESCGDGIVSLDEECDGTNLGGLTCATAGAFDGGNLACDPVTCTFDLSDCSVCGDAVVNGNEECDTGDLDGATCVDAGFPDGGTLACNNGSCTFDTSLCDGEQCGDSIVAGVESCDTNALAGMTCQDQGFVGGSLDCTPGCGFDTAQCSDTVIAVCSGALGLGFDNLSPLTHTLSPTDLGNVGDVDVYVDLLHTFDGDIDMQLRHVTSNTIVNLVFDDCGTAEDMQAFFNDEGNGPADCVSPIAIEGNLTPETPLSAIDGQLIASDWELILVDDASGDSGVLNDWCLYITAQ